MKLSFACALGSAPAHRAAAGPLLFFVVLVAAACGRSDLDRFDAVADGGALGPASDGSMAQADAGIGDRCPSAVTGPAPMPGNCSTRDGRSRVPAPTRTPHVTWTATLPTDPMRFNAIAALSTDATNHVFVVSTSELGSPNAPAIRRIDARDGTIDWTTPLNLCDRTGPAVLLANGRADLFTCADVKTRRLFTFSAADGTATSTTFGLAQLDAFSLFAVGSEGSLYLVAEDARDPSYLADFVVRVTPDGAVAWRSVNLDTLGPAPKLLSGGVMPSNVALAGGDLVVVAHDVFTGDERLAVISALDPANGQTRWSKTVNGSIEGGPAIRPDGSIAMIVERGDPNAALMVNLAAKDGNVTTHPIPFAAEIFAVTQSGIVLVGARTEDRLGGITALAPDGSVVWTQPGALDATIASNGLVVARWGTGLVAATSIVALDEATGAKVWELEPPTSPGPSIGYVALTSAGGIVAEQGEGIVFGASE